MILFSIIDFWRNASIELLAIAMLSFFIFAFLVRIMFSVERTEKMVKELKEKNKEEKKGNPL